MKLIEQRSVYRRRCNGKSVATERFHLADILILCSLLAMVPVATAELYRWQDANGNWQFSDAPPKDSSLPEVMDKVDADEKIESKTEDDSLARESSDSAQATLGSLGEDYAQMLKAKYPDATPITKVTMAVVAIETPLGSGSGFFISDQGHIITNKHVVRPTQMPAMRESLVELEQQSKRFNDFSRELIKERVKLENLKKKLNQRRIEIDRMGSGVRKTEAEEDYKDFKERYTKRHGDYAAANEKFRHENTAFERFRAELSIKSSLSEMAKRFDIFLKNDFKTQAVLVSLSKKYDLALLKLESGKTPYLTLGIDAKPAQGSTVYAVGSPLGMRDSVTKGIITGYKSEFFLTDTQILPGNSGGPLVSEDGVVLGVNTMKLAEEANRQGFGLAIPASAIHEAFEKSLPIKVNE